ncbi:Uncharacterized protein dnm_077470 [Desulfonema magnum]|uniref:Uncharacterized protein n=1 Tax=Desulfonema magnum TaxID=45655 RepID=A0A975BUX2_9BACT|nr:Uncharacterized protein dnm_077470 [Desulfonema magnum]
MVLNHRLTQMTQIARIEKIRVIRVIRVNLWFRGLKKSKTHNLTRS